MKPVKHKFTLLKQVMDTIPAYLVTKLAREHGVDKQSRTFSLLSHVVSMVFAHPLPHALSSLNDICDALRYLAQRAFWCVITTRSIITALSFEIHSS